ncbi:MAG TPA: nucleotide disphospho-sugar-binding domain-containing protein, partial [Opitutaceae bacterium]|nr:nucleotide disphospho-sugar-binding domain-containing protein [Opitutaceae bacterium]
IRTPVYQLREIYVGAKKYIPEMIARMDTALADADLLVSSYLFPMNKNIADRRSVPFATFAFAHQVIPSPDYPPENIPSPKWLGRHTRRMLNRWLWKTGNAVVDRVINSCIKDELRNADLPKVRNFFSEPADRVLVGVSESLMKPNAEIDARFRFTGYCRWQAPENSQLDAELLEFTGGTPVPVLTFGSMVYDKPGEYMERFVRAWPRDKKIIVQRGWAQFPAIGDEDHIKVIGKVSHDQLFKHASAVIHHGGAGTTASALHAGKPQIVVPHIGDQMFFGQEVERLGCGFRIHRRDWPEQLGNALHRLDANPTHREAALRAQCILLSENGPARAVDELERYVAESKAASSAQLQPASGRD